MNLVFVYGTLRPEGGIATHTLRGYMLYDAGAFPYIKPKKGSVVYGNLVEVDDQRLKELDFMESIRTSLYTRAKLTVANVSGQETEAFVYVGGKIASLVNGVPILGGDWAKHSKVTTSFQPWGRGLRIKE